MSFAEFKQEETSKIGYVILYTASTVGLLHVEFDVGEDNKYIRCNNFTLLNLILKFLGPMHERSLTVLLLSLQCFCTGIAFFIRYYISTYFY